MTRLKTKPFDLEVLYTLFPFQFPYFFIYSKPTQARFIQIPAPNSINTPYLISSLESLEYSYLSAHPAIPILDIPGNLFKPRGTSRAHP